VSASFVKIGGDKGILYLRKQTNLYPHFLYLLLNLGQIGFKISKHTAV